MALTIRQATAPDGRKFIHFQEDAGKMEIVVSRETVEWALKRFDLEVVGDKGGHPKVAKGSS